MWFSVLVRKVIKRASFSSTTDLEAQVLACIWYFQHCVVTEEHTLPLQVGVEPAHATDFTMGPTSVDRLLKTAADHALPLTVRAVVSDSGQDALGIYRFVQAKHIAPVMALHPRRGEHPTPTGTAPQVNDHGIPLCPAGLPMRRHSHDPQRARIYSNCPAKRPTRRHGRIQGVPHQEACPRPVLCQPDTQMGPVVYVRTADDPRLYPPIPRDSAQCKALMDQRSGCEQSKALKKVTYRLGERPCRSATHFLVRLYLVSLLEHARVWLAEDRKQLGDAPRSLVDGWPVAA